MNIIRISDGLGNQMFQYAFARKLNIMTKSNVYLDTRFINNEDVFEAGQRSYFKGKLGHREYGLPYFRIVLPAADDKVLSHWRYLQQNSCVEEIIYTLSMQDRWFWRYQDEASNFSGKISGQKMKMPTYYQGYFFDLAYYDDIRPILQHEFSLKKRIKLPKKLQHVLAGRNTVSLHVRRGDFLKLNHDISESGYYKKAIQLMEDKVAHPVYLIFSDEINWVKENIDIPGEKIYISEMGFKDYEELTIMKHCRHNIIANSTFSYWAAYLNSNADKIVVCPKRWKSRIIPEGWRHI